MADMALPPSVASVPSPPRLVWTLHRSLAIHLRGETANSLVSTLLAAHPARAHRALHLFDPLSASRCRFAVLSRCSTRNDHIQAWRTTVHAATAPLSVTHAVHCLLCPTRSLPCSPLPTVPHGVLVSSIHRPCPSPPRMAHECHLHAVRGGAATGSQCRPTHRAGHTPHPLLLL